jgi:hypothetical protein
MKNPNRRPGFAVIALLTLFSPGLAAQNVVRVGNVVIQPHEIPAGWTLVSDTSKLGVTMTDKNARNLTNEVMIRIEEARLGFPLSTVMVQKFESEGKLVEIKYFGGVTEEDMAGIYSTVAREDETDAVVHKGRFAIAIKSSSPNLVRTAVKALRPAPLDRIKILDLTLSRGERVKGEILANRFQREKFQKHFDILPRDVLNQFFEGGGRRQITYVACGSIDDASRAAGPLRRMSEGKSRVLAEGRFLVEIVGDKTWAAGMERLLLPGLLDLVAEEKKALEAARQNAAAGDGTAG